MQAEQDLEYTETFLDVFGSFLKELEAKVKFGSTEFESATTQCTDLVALFGEDPKQVKPKDFF